VAQYERELKKSLLRGEFQCGGVWRREELELPNMQRGRSGRDLPETAKKEGASSASRTPSSVE